MIPLITNSNYLIFKTMDKKKAERLDKILQVLTMVTGLDKAQIQGEVQEEIFYSDLQSIRAQKYNGNSIVSSKLERRHRYYKLTVEGAAFKNDVGFVKLQQTESRNRIKENVNLIVALASIIIAAATFIFSLVQSDKQSSQVDSLEKRIDKIEMNLK